MHFRNKHLSLLLGFAASIVSHSDPTAPIFLAIYHRSVSLCWLSWHYHTSSSGLACPSLELAGSGEGKWGVCCLHTLGNCFVLKAAEATDSQGCCRRRPGSFTQSLILFRPTELLCLLLAVSVHPRGRRKALPAPFSAGD